MVCSLKKVPDLGVVCSDAENVSEFWGGLVAEKVSGFRVCLDAEKVSRFWGGLLRC